jgi:hypothetical protein
MWATPFMVFSVTYYSELHIAIKVYLECKLYNVE